MNSSLKEPEIEELFSEEAIQRRVKEIAQQIARDYMPIFRKNKHNFRLVFIGILSGAEPFFSDLVQEVGRLFPRGYIEKEYISVSRPQHNQSGSIRLLLDTKKPLQGAYVIIVDDIVDTGRTMAYLKPRFSSRVLSGLELCALLDKTPFREKEIEIHYVGFALPKPYWVVGYGLDDKGKYRELSFIGYIPSEQIESKG